MQSLLRLFSAARISLWHSVDIYSSVNRMQKYGQFENLPQPEISCPLP